MKTFSYVAAIIGGAVAGATAALLLAPEKGEDTRAKIQDTVKAFDENGESMLITHFDTNKLNFGDNKFEN